MFKHLYQPEPISGMMKVSHTETKKKVVLDSNATKSVESHGIGYVIDINYQEQYYNSSAELRHINGAYYNKPGGSNILNHTVIDDRSIKHYAECDAYRYDAQGMGCEESFNIIYNESVDEFF